MFVEKPMECYCIYYFNVLKPPVTPNTKSKKENMYIHRYHTVFLPSDVFRRILSQMRKHKKTEDRDGQFVY